MTVTNMWNLPMTGLPIGGPVRQGKEKMTEREIFYRAIMKINKRRAERGQPSARYIIELDGKIIRSKTKDNTIRVGGNERETEGRKMEPLKAIEVLGREKKMLRDDMESAKEETEWRQHLQELVDALELAETALRAMAES